MVLNYVQELVLDLSSAELRRRKALYGGTVLTSTYSTRVAGMEL